MIANCFPLNFSLVRTARKTISLEGAREISHRDKKKKKKQKMII